MLNQEVKFQSTNDYTTAIGFLYDDVINKKLIAVDFEVASKYSDKEKEEFKKQLETVTDVKDKQALISKINSNGLSHPSLTEITHCSMAWSSSEAYVFICDNEEIRGAVLRFLTSTDIPQIWHNFGFDGLHIYYATHKFPKHIIDTQLLSKTLLNDANSFRDKTGLKDLMAYAYGAWAISKDEFTKDNMYDPTMLKYSATDACATYKLYQDIQEDLNSWKI